MARGQPRPDMTAAMTLNFSERDVHSVSGHPKVFRLREWSDYFEPDSSHKLFTKVERQLASHLPAACRNQHQPRVKTEVPAI